MVASAGNLVRQHLVAQLRHLVTQLLAPPLIDPDDHRLLAVSRERVAAADSAALDARAELDRGTLRMHLAQGRLQEACHDADRDPSNAGIIEAVAQAEHVARLRAQELMHQEQRAQTAAEVARQTRIDHQLLQLRFLGVTL